MKKEKIFLEEILQIDVRKHKVIAIVGAGGKTTLLYALAKEWLKKGRTVVVTTTTHMIPRYQNEIITKGLPCKNSEKIKSLSEEDFEELCHTYDLVLVEADGAHCLPMKAPAEYEPVIPVQADMVIGILGALAVGKSLKETCQRFEIAKKILEIDSDETVKIEHLSMLLHSTKGQKKQVKTDYRMVIGQGDLLIEDVILENIVLLSFGKNLEVYKYEN